MKEARTDLRPHGALLSLEGKAAIVTGGAMGSGKAALFLASELSSYMTGAQIVVDGGVLLH